MTEFGVANKTTECVIDTLLFECHFLMDELFTDNDTVRQQEVLRQYVIDIKSKYLQIGDFEEGLEWFNVSEPLSLQKHLRGKVVVLDFFTYCCINCMHIMPYLRELEKEFSVDDGLVVVGVHTAKFDNEKQSANVQTAVHRFGITHPVVNDAEADLWYRLGVTCWPTLLVLGPNGEGLYLFLGEGQKEHVMLLVKAAMQYYKTEGLLSDHKLPIALEAHLPPSTLRFPGNVAFCSIQNNRDTSGGDTTGDTSGDTPGDTSAGTSGNCGDTAGNSGDTSADTVVNSGDTSAGTSGNSGDTAGNPGDTSADTVNSGDTIANSGDTIANSGDTVVNSGDTVVNSGDTVNSSDTVVNSGDTSGNSDDTVVNSGDTSGNSGDTSGNSGDTSGNSGDTDGNSGSNDRLAVADTGHHRIIILTVTGKVEYLVGRNESGFIDGSLSEARFCGPQGIIFRNPDILYVADTGNHAIREINLKTQFVRTLAGTGVPGVDTEGGALWTKQVICSPWGLCLVSSSKDNTGEKDILLIAMAGTHQIWALFLKNASLWGRKKHAEGTCVAVCGNGKEQNRNTNKPKEASFAQPSGLTMAPNLQDLFVADSESSSIRRISLINGKVSPVVGATRFASDLYQFGDCDGTQYEVRLQHPLGVAWCERNKTLYILDSYNHKLKAVDVFTNTCTTVFGTGKSGNAVGSYESPQDVQLNEPGGLCINEAGDVAYVADTNNHCIKVVHLEKKIVEQLDIVLPPEHEVDSKNTKSTHVVNAEVLINSAGGTLNTHVLNAEVLINSAGGTLKLNLTVSLDDNVTFTEDTPQKWNLVLPGDAWSADTNQGEHTPETLLEISVPEAKHDETAELFVNYQLFVCYQHSACSRQNLQIAVTVKYDDSAPKEVAHCISHIVTAKGLPSSA